MDNVPPTLTTVDTTINSVGGAFPSTAPQDQATSSAPQSPSRSRSPRGQQQQHQQGTPLVASEAAQELREGGASARSAGVGFVVHAAAPGHGSAAVATADSSPVAGIMLTAVASVGVVVVVVGREGDDGASVGGDSDEVMVDAESGVGSDEGALEECESGDEEAYDGELDEEHDGSEMDVGSEEVMVDVESGDGGYEGDVEGSEASGEEADGEYDEEMEAVQPDEEGIEDEGVEEEEMQDGEIDEEEAEDEEMEEETEEEETEEEETEEEETEEEDDDKDEDTPEDMKDDSSESSIDEYEARVRGQLVDSDYDPYDPSGAPPNATWFGEDRFEEPFFHRVVHAIDYYGMGWKPPFVRCAICTDTQLSIRGLPLYEAREAEDRASLPNIARGVVLICGHMLCKPCWTLNEAHHRSNNPLGEDEAPLRCPVCRAELYHRCCGCRIPALNMPINAADPAASAKYVLQWGRYYDYAKDQWALDFPRTLNDGGSVPGVCKKCSRR